MNPRSQLNLIGSKGDNSWQTYMKQLIKHLKVKRVTFTGSISQPDLMAYYRHSDLFLCMSEHEGLCVPLVEAMVCDLPVIAYDAAAVGETIGTGGILVKEKRFAEIAELADYVLNHEQLKTDLSIKQKELLKKFSAEKIKESWREVLNYVDSL